MWHRQVLVPRMIAEQKGTLQNPVQYDIFHGLELGSGFR